jgi:O-antigen ligase
LSLALQAWLLIHVGLSLFALVYLVSNFGTLLFSESSRAPFQVAMNAVVPTWPNGAGLTLAASACLAFAPIRVRRGGFLAWAQFLALLMGVVLTFSRNAWLATVVGLAVMSIVGGFRLRTMGTLMIVGLFVLVVGWEIPGVRYQLQASFMPGSGQHNSLIERLAFGIEALRVWAQQPVVGIGFRRFEEFADLGRLLSGAAVSASYVPGSVHNEYLTTLLKGGIVTLVTFLAVLVTAWRLLVARMRSELAGSAWQRWAVAGLGMMAALGVAGLGAESFRTISVSAPMWLLIGALSQYASAQHRDRAVP